MMCGGVTVVLGRTLTGRDTVACKRESAESGSHIHNLGKRSRARADLLSPVGAIKSSGRYAIRVRSAQWVIDSIEDPGNCA